MMGGTESDPVPVHLCKWAQLLWQDLPSKRGGPPVSSDGGGRTVTLGRKSQQRIMGMMDAASHQSIHAKRSIVASLNL
jgi:hypothetical protein